MPRRRWPVAAMDLLLGLRHRCHQVFRYRDFRRVQQRRKVQQEARRRPDRFDRRRPTRRRRRDAADFERRRSPQRTS